MNAFTFQDMKIGMSASFTATVTEKMMDDFFLITGDGNPLHRNASFAKNVGYPDRVAYGMLTASFLSTLGGGISSGEIFADSSG